MKKKYVKRAAQSSSISRRTLEATNQLKFWPYGHIKHARTGLIDLFVELYAARDKEAPNDIIEFAATLDPKKIEREFKAVAFFEGVVDRVLRRE